MMSQYCLSGVCIQAGLAMIDHCGSEFINKNPKS